MVQIYVIFEYLVIVYYQNIVDLTKIAYEPKHCSYFYSPCPLSRSSFGMPSEAVRKFWKKSIVFLLSGGVVLTFLVNIAGLKPPILPMSYRSCVLFPFFFRSFSFLFWFFFVLFKEGVKKVKLPQPSRMLLNSA